MEVNKVEWYSNPIIDLTNDTVVPENLLLAETAHSSDGILITGEAAPYFSISRSVTTLSSEITLQPNECTNRTITWSRTSTDTIVTVISNLWVIETGATSVLSGALNVDCHVARTTNSYDSDKKLSSTRAVVVMRNLSDEAVSFKQIYYIRMTIKGSWVKGSCWI